MLQRELEQVQVSATVPVKRARVHKVKQGRPAKIVESPEILKQIEGLARIQCTMREAAAVLSVHVDTFSDFLHAYPAALAAWEDGRYKGRASMRRNQSKMAETNPTMSIWLGKQYLDQHDKVNTQVTGNVVFEVVTGVPRAAQIEEGDYEL